ncbi:MAG: hypothetical protein HUU54_10205 [Ignavibacteriaceae bacterium]|nr:hypothetical protein [Ignavibacteriaceae bacterium]
MTIYPITYNEDTINSVLSLKTITPADLDYDRAQSEDDFVNFKKLHIKYMPDDFLVLLSEETESMLTIGVPVGLDEADVIGWYGTRAHEANISILNESGGMKLKNILSLNPALRLQAFETIRRGYALRKRKNVLAGGFGLCYHCFREEYDAFFAKLKFSGNSWILKLSDYNQKTDGFILFQLLIFSGQRMEGFISEIFEGNPLFNMLAPLCVNSAIYFSDRSYDVKDYLKFTARALRASPDADDTAGAIEELLNNYVEKGIPWEPEDTFARIIKEFIDLAATDTENLRKFLESSPTNRKAVVFLLGMLHTASRLEDQFGFDNFAQLLPAVIADRFDCIRKKNGEIHLAFNSPLTNRLTPAGADQLELVNDYISGIHTIKTILPEINRIKNACYTLDSITGSEKVINSLKKEIPELRETSTRLRDENGRLQADIEKMKSRNSILSKQKQELEQNYKNLIKDFEALQTRLESIKRENALLRSPEAALPAALQPEKPAHSDPASEKNGALSVLKQYEKIVEDEERKMSSCQQGRCDEQKEELREMRETANNGREKEKSPRRHGKRSKGAGLEFKDNLIKTPGGAAGGLSVNREGSINEHNEEKS